MKPVNMHPAAEQELNDVVDHCWAIDPDLADAFVDSFDLYRAKIAENPLQYNIRPGGGASCEPSASVR